MGEQWSGAGAAWVAAAGRSREGHEDGGFRGQANEPGWGKARLLRISIDRLDLGWAGRGEAGGSSGHQRPLRLPSGRAVLPRGGPPSPAGLRGLSADDSHARPSRRGAVWGYAVWVAGAAGAGRRG